MQQKDDRNWQIGKLANWRIGALALALSASVSADWLWEPVTGLYFDSQEAMEHAIRTDAPNGGSHEVAFLFSDPFSESPASRAALDYRVAGSLAIGAELPPAEYAPEGFAIWNVASNWRVELQCGSSNNPALCESEAALVTQINQSYAMLFPATCITSPAVALGSPTSGLSVYNLALAAADDPQIHRLVGGKINYGAPNTQSYRIQIKIKSDNCTGIERTLTWPIARQKRFVCPENFRINLAAINNNPNSYCISSINGRGPLSTTLAGKSAAVSKGGINPPEKLIPYGPPRDPETCPRSGNPCELATGKKVESYLDFTHAGIAFQRFYDSVRENADYGNLGPAWQHSFSTRVITTHLTAGHYVSSASSALLQSERGFLVKFIGSGSLHASDSSGDTLTLDTANWVLTKANGNRIIFNLDGYPIRYEYQSNPAGNLTLSWQSELASLGANNAEYMPRRLTRVENAVGRALHFEYTPQGRPRLRRIRADSATGAVLATYKYQRESIWPTAALPDAHAFGNLVRAELPGITAVYGYKILNGFDTALLTSIAYEYGGVLHPFGIYEYDIHSRVSSSQRVGGLNTLTPSYQTTGTSVTATTALGATMSATLQNNAFKRPLSITHGSGASAEETTFEYNTSGRRTFMRKRINSTVWNVTEYIYTNASDVRPFEIIEAKGTVAERKSQTLFDPALNLPTQRTIFDCNRNASTGQCDLQAKQSSKMTYNSAGQLLSQCLIDPAIAGASSYTCGSSAVAPIGVRQSIYTYCDSVNTSDCPIVGLIKTMDGARIDVVDTTSYSYRMADAPDLSYRKGDLWKITNALGHVLEYLAFDNAGRALKMRDANLVETWMSYHPRGWLLSRTVKGATATEDATTSFAYTPFGAIERVTQPDGAFLQYGYDAAQRLTGISDNGGNAITYVLDAAGNRVKESTTDSASVVKRLMARQYDQLSRMRASIRAPFADAPNLDDTSVRKTNMTFDASGNTELTTDPSLGTPAVAGTVTDNDYDPLSRLIKTLQDVGGIAAKVEYGFDVLDRMTSVKDPKNLNTVYAYDGLSNLTSLTSPDTGISSYLYDAAGNRTQQTDARGVKSNMTYDALNRLRKIEYTPAGSTVVNALKTVEFFYDETTIGCTSNFATGRMSRFTDESGNTKLCYDRRGNVVQKTQVTSNATQVLAMTFSVADRLSGITYPSGTTVSYGRDNQGRITSLNINGSSFVKAVSYLPFGPINQISFQNGKTLTKTYDQNYDIDSIVSTATGGLNLDYSVDEVGNIKQVNQSGMIFNLNYDKLYRLTSVKDQNQALIEGFTYDATGNRLSKQLGSNSPVNYSYAATEHRLTSAGDGARAFDLNGNTLNTPLASVLNYDERNRLVARDQRKSSSVVGKVVKPPFNTAANDNFEFNARGERVQAYYGFGNRVLLKTHTYDESGKMLADGEQDFIYLDSIPIAHVQYGIVYPIEADHLGSPRVIQDVAGSSAVWTWNLLANTATGSNAFGEQASLPANNEFRLRFPGQYFDGKGLNYNYFRDYEPGTGRYVESDPIGLGGGLSTFGYVGGGPLNHSDRRGLAPELSCQAACIGAGAAAGGAAGYFGGGALGGVVGGALGGAGGTAVGPGGTVAGVSIGSSAGASAGSSAGGAAGAAAGGMLGAAMSYVVCPSDDFCYKRWEIEDSNCGSRFGRGPKEDRQAWYRGCKIRAAERRRMCDANGGKPVGGEPSEWGDGDE